MNDDVLFASAPYLAVCVLLVAAAYRSLNTTGPPVDTLHRPDDESPAVRTMAVACALALAALHTVLLSAPDAVLRWNRDGRRLLALESAGVLIGAVCLAGLARMIWRHRPAPAARRDTAIGNVVTVTLIGVAIVSGLMLALLYRWASSWSVVTLTPYVVSLMNGKPRVEFVARMPFLVRLHVFSTFAIVAAIPFTAAGSAALVAMRRAAAGASAPAAQMIRSRGIAAGDWTRRLVRPLVSWKDEES